MRRLSLANLLLIPLLTILSGRTLNLSMLTYGVLISVSVILMIPDTYNDGKASVLTGFAVFISAMFAGAADCLFYPDWGGGIARELVYPLLAGIPTAVLFTVRAFRMMGDIVYLTIKTSGWEIMLCVIDQCYLAFLMALVAMNSSMAGMSGRGIVWWRVIVLALSLSLFGIVYLRSITGGPVISYSESGVPSGEKNVEECACQDGSASNYKVMYDRLCGYMDKNRPYLDPDYTLENLARGMFSNKVYISKLINISTGMNFSQLMNRYRIDYARELFRADTTLKVKDLSDMSGFHTQVTFITAFKLFYGMTPGAWCRDYVDGLKLLSSSREQERKPRPESFALDE